MDEEEEARKNASRQTTTNERHKKMLLVLFLSCERESLIDQVTHTNKHASRAEKSHFVGLQMGNFLSLGLIFLFTQTREKSFFWYKVY